MLPATRDIWQGHPSTQAWKVHQQESGSITDLHQAAWNGDESSIQYLLSQGQQVDVSDQQGRTPLHSAALGNRPEVIKLLLHCNASLNATSFTGDTPLHLAAAQGCTAALETLLIQGADPTGTNAKAQTPLYLAVEHEQLAAVQMLCQAAPAAVSCADEWGLTPLHVAARVGNPDTVRVLLQCQADPMLQSWDQRTPLHFAAQHQHPAVIRQLLMHPSLRQDPSTPYAMPDPISATMQQETKGHDNSHTTGRAHSSNQDQDMTSAEPIPIDNAHPQVLPSPAEHDFHQTAGMHPATDWRHQGKRISEDTVQAASSLQSLHSGGTQHYNPPNLSNDPPNPSNDPPNPSSQRQGAAGERAELGGADELDYTAADSEAMDALLALTSDISVQSPPKLQGPADHFQWQKHLLSLRDHQGNTALHLAVMEGVQESVQLLLQAGADTATPGMQQQTPLKMAQQFKHRDIVQLLLEAGAL